MRNFLVPIVILALFSSLASSQAQLTDEERRAKIKERSGKSGGGKESRGRGEDSAPKVGEKAPDLGVRKMLDGESFNLSDPNRIAVLIFGSHT